MSDFDPAAGGDIAVDAAPDAGGDPSTPDGGFSDVNFEQAFGLEPDAPVDVPQATDPPSPRQAEDVVPTGEEAPAEVKTEPDVETPTDDQFKPNDKLNWDDDKVPFRNEYNDLKKAYKDLWEKDVESQYLNDPVAFSNWMKETSPTSFNEIGAHIATESAQSHPKEWLQFFAKNHPDTLAEIASGREGMTAERLKAELEIMLDDDDEDVQAVLEKNKAAGSDKPTETPEQKQLREWREERDAEAYTKVVGEVFAPIETAVENLVSQAGLEIKESEYQGKPFHELDEDTQFKVMVNELIPLWIDYRVKQDPKLVSMQTRLDGFLQQKDLTSAKALQHPAQIAATNFASELLSLVTGKKASAKTAETKPPANDTPAPMVRSNGAAAPPQTPTGFPSKDDWTVTDADL